MGGRPHLFLSHEDRRRWACIRLRSTLLIRVVMVMVMMMMVMAVDNHHNLRLRRVRYREAEDESQCEQNPFHTSVSRTPAPFAELL